METAVVKAVGQKGTLLYAFGEKWGPEKEVKDKYFKFLPGNGIHDIHMNQGNSGPYRKDNGAYQDGGLVFQYPDGKWTAFFFAFQSQTFDTDDNGNPAHGAGQPTVLELASRAMASKAEAAKHPMKKHPAKAQPARKQPAKTGSPASVAAKKAPIRKIA